MGKTSKSAWTGFERDVARDLAAVTGTNVTRNPLSGANNRNDDGSARIGDVIVPPGLKMVLECKYRSSNAQHTLFDGVVADTKKASVDPANAILCTKEKRSRGYLVTIDSRLFWTLLRLPGALELFKTNAHPGGTDKK